jgi:hypothetical protein
LYPRFAAALGTVFFAMVQSQRHRQCAVPGPIGSEIGVRKTGAAGQD